MSQRSSRPRLGRGLEALLGADVLAPDPSPSDVRTLSLSLIAPNPYQPRREFSEEELEDLKRSIEANGLLQPPVVRPVPGSTPPRYELVAGERRFRSVQALGWTDLPVLVREVDDRTLLVLALVENIQRASLGPLEEAEAYRVLSDEFSLTQAEIAEAVGKKRATVANALRLLKLPPSVRRLLEDGSLSMGHARALLAVEDTARLTDLCRRCVEGNWSVRETEARVRAIVGPSSKAEDAQAGSAPPGSPAPTGAGGQEFAGDPNQGGGLEPSESRLAARALLEELRRALGTRVLLKGTPNGAGVLEIPYHSAEDLERLFHLLTGVEASDILN
jgi:ParB family transcriptional regulator, chromosome partitioning protein